MEETAIPQKQLNMQRVSEDLNPTIEKIETEDEKISQLANQVGWEALRDRIKRKIKSIEDNTKITSGTVSLIDDIQLYGFKCMAKDLLVEAYQGIIDDVEETAKFLKGKKDDESDEKEGRKPRRG